MPTRPGAPSNEQAHFLVNMDGEWDLDDLRSLTSAIRLSYAYFYWINEDPKSVDSAVRSGIARYFWTGEFIGDRFAETLYGHIPEARRLKIASIRYESPGWMDLLGYLPTVTALGLVVKLWISNFDKTFELFQKVDRYFRDRKLRDLRDKGSIKDIDGQFVEEARVLAVEYGHALEPTR